MFDAPSIAYDPTLIADLRARMRAAGLTAMLVPHADANQSEYLPPNAERLARLTGFTGSAGFCIVLADEAAVFVDGRYTLQVKEEVDETIFTPNPSPPSRRTPGCANASNAAEKWPTIHGSTPRRNWHRSNACATRSAQRWKPWTKTPLTICGPRSPHRHPAL